MNIQLRYLLSAQLKSKSCSISIQQKTYLKIFQKPARNNYQEEPFRSFYYEPILKEADWKNLQQQPNNGWRFGCVSYINPFLSMLSTQWLQRDIYKPNHPPISCLILGIYFFSLSKAFFNLLGASCLVLALLLTLTWFKILAKVSQAKICPSTNKKWPHASSKKLSQQSCKILRNLLKLEINNEQT